MDDYSNLSDDELRSAIAAEEARIGAAPADVLTAGKPLDEMSDVELAAAIADEERRLRVGVAEAPTEAEAAEASPSPSSQDSDDYGFFDRQRDQMAAQRGNRALEGGLGAAEAIVEGTTPILRSVQEGISRDETKNKGAFLDGTAWSDAIGRHGDEPDESLRGYKAKEFGAVETGVRRFGHELSAEAANLPLFVGEAVKGVRGLARRAYNNRATDVLIDYARDAGFDDADIEKAKEYSQGDPKKMHDFFRDAAETELRQDSRVKAAAQQRLSENEEGLGSKIVGGALGMIPMIEEFALGGAAGKALEGATGYAKLLKALPNNWKGRLARGLLSDMGEVGVLGTEFSRRRYGELTADEYAEDEDGNLVKKEGDSAGRALAKSLPGGFGEAAIFAKLGKFGQGLTPAITKLLRTKAGNAVANTYANYVKYGNMTGLRGQPKMLALMDLNAFKDEVMGLGMKDEDYKGFDAEWKRFTDGEDLPDGTHVPGVLSLEGQGDMFMSALGVMLLQGGAAGANAWRSGKAQKLSYDRRLRGAFEIPQETLDGMHPEVKKMLVRVADRMYEGGDALGGGKAREVRIEQSKGKNQKGEKYGTVRDADGNVISDGSFRDRLMRWYEKGGKRLGEEAKRQFDEAAKYALKFDNSYGWEKDVYPGQFASGFKVPSRGVRGEDGRLAGYDVAWDDTEIQIGEGRMVRGQVFTDPETDISVMRYLQADPKGGDNGYVYLVQDGEGHRATRFGQKDAIDAANAMSSLGNRNRSMRNAKAETLGKLRDSVKAFQGVDFVPAKTGEQFDAVLSQFEGKPVSTGRGTRGVTLPDGRVMLCLDRIETPQQMKDVMLHEVGRHKGLDLVFEGDPSGKAGFVVGLARNGDPVVQNQLRVIADNMVALGKIDKPADIFKRDRDGNYLYANKLEEVYAHLFDRGDVPDEPGWWDEHMVKLRQNVRKVFRGLSYSRAEAEAMYRGAMDRLAEKTGGEIFYEPEREAPEQRDFSGSEAERLQADVDAARRRTPVRRAGFKAAEKELAEEMGAGHEEAVKKEGDREQSTLSAQNKAAQKAEDEAYEEAERQRMEREAQEERDAQDEAELQRLIDAEERETDMAKREEYQRRRREITERRAREKAEASEQERNRQDRVLSAIDRAKEAERLDKKRKLAKAAEVADHERRLREAEEANDLAAYRAEEERWAEANRLADEKRDQDYFDRNQGRIEEERARMAAEAKQEEPNEAGNGADEAQPQPEQGAGGQAEPEVAGSGSGAAQGAEAQTADVVEPKPKVKTKRGDNLRGYSYEDYGADPDGGGTGDQMGAALLRWVRDSGGLLKMPPKGAADPMADWIRAFLDGGAKKSRRGDYIALFGMKPRTGTNDAIAQNMPDGLKQYVENMIEREGPQAVADWFLDVRQKYSEWAANKRNAAREEKAVAKERAEEAEALESFNFDELAAARDAMDAEFADALGVVEGADEADYVTLSPSSLRSAKAGDTIRFDHDARAFNFGSFDAERGVLTVYDEEAAGREGEKFRRVYRVTENSIEEIDDGNGQGHEGRADADRAGNEEGAAGGRGEGQGDARGEETGIAATESSVKRRYTREPIAFSKPFVGKTGAKLVGYEWPNKGEEYVDKRGNDRVRRISDWDYSETNGETGRDIVHKFIVEMPHGERRTVSAESAAKLLGVSASQVKGEGLKQIRKAMAAESLTEAQKKAVSEAKNGARIFVDNDGTVHLFTEINRDFPITLFGFEHIAVDRKGRTEKLEPKRSDKFSNKLIELDRADIVGENKPADFSLEAATPEQLAAEKERQKQRDAIRKGLEAPIKGSGPIDVQPEFDLGQTGQGDLFAPVVENKGDVPAAPEQAKTAPASAPQGAGATTPPKAEKPVEGRKSGGTAAEAAKQSPEEPAQATTSQTADGDSFDILKAIGDPDYITDWNRRHGVKEATDAEIRAGLRKQIVDAAQSTYDKYRNSVLKNSDAVGDNEFLRVVRDAENVEDFVKGVNGLIEKHRAVRDDWASRSYKTSRKRVEVTDRSDAFTMAEGETNRLSTDYINERRRRNRVEGEEREMARLRESLEKVLGKQMLEDLETKYLPTVTAQATPSRVADLTAKAEALAAEYAALSPSEQTDEKGMDLERRINEAWKAVMEAEGGEIAEGEAEPAAAREESAPAHETPDRAEPSPVAVTPEMKERGLAAMRTLKGDAAKPTDELRKMLAAAERQSGATAERRAKALRDLIEYKEAVAEQPEKEGGYYRGTVRFFDADEEAKEREKKYRDWLGKYRLADSEKNRREWERKNPAAEKAPPTTQTRVTPAEDAAYIDAVKRGDMETAERLADEAAKRAGYNHVAYHGTPFGGWSEYDLSRGGMESGNGRGVISLTSSRPEAEAYSKGDSAADVSDVMFKVNKVLSKIPEKAWKVTEGIGMDGERFSFDSAAFSDYAEEFTRRPDEFDFDSPAEYKKAERKAERDGYLAAMKSVLSDMKSVMPEYGAVIDEAMKTLDGASPQNPEVKKLYVRMENAFKADASPKTYGSVAAEAEQRIREGKNDGAIIRLEDGTLRYFVKDSAQIKSADAITRDNSGNVIPLSQRFNQSSPDIRFFDAAEEAKDSDELFSVSPSGQRSRVGRNRRYGVGKDMMGKVYFHKNYAEDVVPQDILAQARKIAEERGFDYNTMMYDPKNRVVRLDESPDFDTAREPHPGRQLRIDPNGTAKELPYQKQIFHHKWAWVKDDYKGFDVQESKDWSRRWLSANEGKGSPSGWMEKWNEKLDELGLPRDGAEPPREKQTALSGDTSLNQNPSGNRYAQAHGLFKPGTRNIDIGAGKFDKATQFLREQGVENIPYDPVNRDAETNRRAAESVRENPADTATVHNVLNVIDNDAVMEGIVNQAARAIKKDGTAIFTIYEGDRSGNGRVTTKGYQRNAKASAYVPVLEKYFGEVKTHGNVITARQPKDVGPAFWAEDSSFDRGLRFFDTRDELSPREEMERERRGIGGIFTGTASDYANRSRRGGVEDGPSLQKIGSGEGSQVYGWGLYGSNVRGVAEGYAARGSGKSIVRKKGTEVGSESSEIEQIAKAEIISSQGVNKALSRLKDYVKGHEGDADYDFARSVIREIENGDYDISSPGNLYEQTFFTDRAPGDESHLLKWYEPVSEENANRILDRLSVEFGSETAPSGAVSSRDYPLVYASGERASGFWTNRTGEQVYNELSSTLGSPQAASEFLARAGIDGVKYPVDSYGGKGVKDGDKVGWNYVSFRDDNIRVDHKWVDGEMRFFNIDESAARRVHARGQDEARRMEGAGAGRREIWEKTGWWKGKDGKWRYEIKGISDADTRKMLDFAYSSGKFYDRDRANVYTFTFAELEKAMRERGEKLPDSVKTLIAAYPKLASEKIEVDRMAEQPAGILGYATSGGSKGTIHLYERGATAETLNHELQHRIQERSGMAGGTNTNGKSFDRYAHEHGEWEARQAATRAGMSDAERSGTAPWETADRHGVEEDATQIDDRNRARIRPDGEPEEPEPPAPFMQDEGGGLIDKAKRVMRKAKTELIDREEPVRQMEIGAGKRGKKDLFREGSPYNALRLLPGKQEAAKKRFEDTWKKPYMQMIRKYGVTDDDVGMYGIAMNAKDRNRKLTERGGVLDGAGLSDADADKMLADLRRHLGDRKFDAIKDVIFPHLWKMQKEGLKRRVASGRVSKELAEKWEKDEPHHVPMRDDLSSEDGSYNRSTRQWTKNDYREANGRYTLPDNPVEFMFMEYQDAMYGANANEARRALADFVRSTPGIGKISRGIRYGRNGAPDMSWREQTTRGGVGRPNLVAFKENGDLYMIELNGKLGEQVAEAVTGRGVRQAWKPYQSAMRAYASTATELSPAFGLRNAIADYLEASLNTMADKGLIKGGASAVKNAVNIIRMWPTIMRWLKTGEYRGAFADTMRRYVDSGALIGGMGNEGFSEIKAEAEKVSSGKKSVGDMIHLVMRPIELWNKRIELGTRLAVFKDYIDGGASDGEAAMRSREYSTDFNKYGKQRWMNSVWMFSGSVIGGAVRQTASLARSDAGRRLATGLVAYGILEAMAEHYFNEDEDEEARKSGKPSGTTMSEFQRANSLYFRNGDKLIRLPFHAGPFSVLKYAGNVIARCALGDMGKDDALLNLGKEASSIGMHFTGTGDFNWDTKMQSLAPTLFVPFIQAKGNEDFAGRPIEKRMYSETKPYSENGRKGTGEVWKDIARGVNAMSGGSDRRRGMFDASPEMYKHWFDALGKNLTRDISSVVDFVTDLKDGKSVGDIAEENTRHILGYGDVVRNVSDNTQNFYEAERRYMADRADGTIKQGSRRDEAVKKLLREIKTLRHWENGEEKVGNRWVKKRNPSEATKKKHKKLRLRYQQRVINLMEK